jgi:hypothetical protein
MKTSFNGLPDQEDLGNPQENHPETSNPEMDASANESGEEKPKHRHHEEHHINRKYRIFSNHSSYGDSPHTNTSF